VSDQDNGLPADRIDTSKPHPARMYDYFLGGRDNYEVDRAAADQVIGLIPEIRPSARANRGVLRRATRFVADRGIRHRHRHPHLAQHARDRPGRLARRQGRLHRQRPDRRRPRRRQAHRHREHRLLPRRRP
jgi:hypothetical protein